MNRNGSGALHYYFPSMKPLQLTLKPLFDSLNQLFINALHYLPYDRLMFYLI